MFTQGDQSPQNASPNTRKKRSKRTPRNAKEHEVRKLPFWDGNLYGLEKLGQGGTAIVFAIDDNTAVKTPIGTSISLEAFEREREVYRRIRQRPCRHVLLCYETEYPLALILERCVEPVRKRLRRLRKGGNLKDIEVDGAMKLALRWSYEAAIGLASLHDQGIIQADVGCHNMLLDSNDSVKISDFSGSNMPCYEPLAIVDYDVHSKLPDHDEPTTQSDLFALGSAMYEMATGSLPYEGASTSRVVSNFRNKRYPAMDFGDAYGPFADIINGCWNLRFNTVHQVVNCLKDLCQSIGVARSVSADCIPLSTEDQLSRKIGKGTTDGLTKSHRRHIHHSRHNTATLRSQGNNRKLKHQRGTHRDVSSRHAKKESFIFNLFASLKI